MHQQRLGGVADAGALHLGVDHDLDRLLEVGARIDEDVAVAAGGIDHRDLRVLDQVFLERLAAAGDDQVDVFAHLQQLLQMAAVAGLHQRDGVRGQPGSR